jgi:2-keto-3-deoxy-L-rhamnonate aldolase RhmA
MALGLQPRKGQSDPAAVDARAKIVERCQAHGVYAGIHQQDAEGTLLQISLGFRFVTIASDNRFLAHKAREEVGSVRSGLASDTTPEVGT